VYRESEYATRMYADHRWTEYPEEYVRRSLARALFERGGVEQATGGSAPVLEIELIAFEEVRRARARFGRVQLGYRLRDDRRVIAAGVVTREREAEPGAGLDPVVAAIAVAMGDATDAVAAEVRARLAPREPG
jgi:hypothetical protein